MAYENGMINLSNPPITGIGPNKKDLILWRGCNSYFCIPCQYRVQRTIGIDDNASGIYDESNNEVDYYTATIFVNIYAEATLTISRQNNQDASPLFKVTVPLSLPLQHVEFDIENNPVYTQKTMIDLATKFAFGSDESLAAYMHFPQIITADFDFEIADYKLECTSRELDTNGKPIVDRIFHGQITMLGEAV